MAEQQYCGVTYRQIVHRLRLNRGKGRADKVSERPREGSRENGWGRYLDSDDNPTLIEFDEYDQIDVGHALRIGAIVPWEPPKPVEVATESESELEVSDNGEGE